jgi:hypothetical protein
LLRQRQKNNVSLRLNKRSCDDSNKSGWLGQVVEADRKMEMLTLITLLVSTGNLNNHSNLLGKQQQQESLRALLLG